MADDDFTYKITVQSSQVGEFLMGSLDVMLALGVSLANAGLLARSDIAEVARRALEQLDRQAASPQRRFSLEILRAFFSTPVVPGHGGARLFTIEGGRKALPPDEPPSAA